MNDYPTKLLDPRWQRKRLEVYQRDDFRCQACGDKDSTLHAHHSGYDGEPWDVPLEMLITLCDKCHALEHTDYVGDDVKAFALGYYRTKVEALEMATSTWMLLNHLGRPVHQFRELAQWLMEVQNDDRTLIEKIWDDYQFDISDDSGGEGVFDD